MQPCAKFLPVLQERGAHQCGWSLTEARNGANGEYGVSRYAQRVRQSHQCAQPASPSRYERLSSAPGARPCLPERRGALCLRVSKQGFLQGGAITFATMHGDLACQSAQPANDRPEKHFCLGEEPDPPSQHEG